MVAKKATSKATPKRAAAKKAPAKTAKPESAGKEMTNWDEELAKYAELSRAQEDTAVGGSGMKYFGTRGGILTFDEEVITGNKVSVIILDSCFEHSYYEGKFDPENPAPPVCFALGRDEGELAPHKTVFDHDQAQSGECESCPMNEFGSADTGRGKACKNIRRLAVIPAGKYNKAGDFVFDNNPDSYARAGMGFIKVPVTSTNAFKTVNKQVTGSLGRPLWGVVVEIRLVPHVKNQFEMQFEVIDEVPNELLNTIFPRVQEAEAVIDTPYNLDVEEKPEPANRGRAKAPAKKSGRSRKY